MSPASMTPMPPGTGAMPPSNDAIVLMTISSAIGSDVP